MPGCFIDGVLTPKDKLDQPDNTRAMIYWGHSPNSQTRLPELKKAMEKLDLLVTIDPIPGLQAVLHDRTDGVYDQVIDKDEYGADYGTEEAEVPAATGETVRLFGMSI